MTLDCTIVLLGATGDLSRRKLIPALYQLLKDKKVTRCALVGVSLEPGSASDMLQAARSHIDDLDEGVWQELVDHAAYLAGDFHDAHTYQRLAAMLDDIEKKHQLGNNRLFYLATMPEHFATITQQLSAHDIVPHRSKLQPQQGWRRVVYEKPFGADGMSADAINAAIHNVFDESQVFRIDHYLGKELVGNIAVLRFANRLFEPLWRAEHIEQVQIIVNENDGIGSRGRYYDKYGALKDMVQNHLFQLMALVGMEPPRTLCGEEIRAAKAAVLSRARIDDVVCGQYEGYQGEQFVRPGSRTETFAALKVSIENERWRGVPFFLKTGKQLYERHASIHIFFKPATGVSGYRGSETTNVLTLQIEPNEGFALQLNAKMPGSNRQVTPISMSWSHHAVFGYNTPQSYESLLIDALRGDQSVFVRFDEIAHSWELLEQYDCGSVEREIYARGGRGPASLPSFEKQHNMEWQR
ncbi:MAG: glucose-6-phosphate dehydrogenase [Candidatus Dependentiae bacterium]|jgi:glucose-6-phosphate 1-dehydrogenase